MDTYKVYLLVNGRMINNVKSVCFNWWRVGYMWYVVFIVVGKVIARLSQSLWTTTPKNFYHPNQLSIRCVV